MEKFIDRLDSFMAKEGLSDNKVTVKAGLSVGLIGKCRKNGSGMASDSIEKILTAYPQLSAGWLITGKGDMYLQEEGRPAGLPLIPLEAFASPGMPVFDDLPMIDYYTVSEFKGSDFLIRIKGDSMSPRYASGDIVACKKILEMLYFQWGRVYVVYTKSNGIMIKRLQPSEDKDCIKCVSDNTKYAPFDVPKSDIVSLALVNGLVSLE